MKTPKIFSTKRQAIENAKKTVVITVTLASMVVSVGLVTVNFLYDLGRYHGRVIKEKEAALNTLNTNKQAVSSLVASFQAFEAGPALLPGQGEKKNSSVVLDALPSKYDFPALATAMESLVKRSGLNLESFGGQDQVESAVQSATQPTAIEIPFSLIVTGPYDDVKAFTDRLQNTIQPMNVDRISLSGSDKEMRAEIDIHTYYQPSVSLELETKGVQ